MPLINGGQIRFMVENLLHAGVNSVTRSSEDSSYPYTNLTGENKNFRARPFKFSGRFEVTALNNKIYFNDGVDQVATIPVGEYITRALLASAIQTAMNTASAGYIVTWNSSSRLFVINGTARILQLSNQVNSSWEMLGFMTIIDSDLGTAHSGNESRMHWPFEFLKFDFGYFPDIGFFALIADANNPLTISPMASVILEANTIDDFTSPPCSLELTRTDRGILKFLDDGDYSYRFWRLRIEDNFSENEIEIGYIYLGEVGRLTDHYNDQGASSIIEDGSIVNESESGQVYSFSKTKQRSYDSISLQLISLNDANFLKDLYNRIGTGAPFFVSVDPKLEITSTLDDATFFCRINDNLKLTHIHSSRYSTNFKLKEWL